MTVWKDSWHQGSLCDCSVLKQEEERFLFLNSSTVLLQNWLMLVNFIPVRVIWEEERKRQLRKSSTRWTCTKSVARFLIND